MIMQQWETCGCAEIRCIGKTDPALDLGTNRAMAYQHTTYQTDPRTPQGPPKSREIRTGEIGLAQFLNSRRVHSYETAKWVCGGWYENPRRIARFSCMQIARISA